MCLVMLKGDFDPMIVSLAELSKYNQPIQDVGMWAPRAPVGSRASVYVVLLHYHVQQYTPLDLPGTRSMTADIRNASMTSPKYSYTRE